jgi:probable HAF family extracellular repeat protein
MKSTTTLLLLVPILCAAFTAAQTYTVTDLGTIGGHLSNATAINDAGQVVGSSYITTQNGLDHAFLWTASTGMQDLGTLPGGNNSSAFGINNLEQVVGCSSISTNNSVPSHAFLWTQSGGMQDISTMGTGSCATAINDLGQVVGEFTVDTNFDYHVFLWTASTGMHDLGLPIGSMAAAINNSGAIVGTYPTSTGSTHAYEWTSAGGLQDLGSLGGGLAAAGGINSYGEVVGSSLDAPSNSDVYSGFRWTSGGKIQPLPSPYPGHDATASAINSTGEIVGFALNSQIQQRATVWILTAHGYVVHDLNQLTVNSPMILDMATGVNPSGQIAGVGRVKANPALAHAYLATPNDK